LPGLRIARWRISHENAFSCRACLSPRCGGRVRRGFARLEWQKLRERNEALDCRVYARAAAWIAGVDRMPETTWGQLEERHGLSDEPVHRPPAPPRPAAPSPFGRIRLAWPTSVGRSGNPFRR
jgi:phage terminase large subunit GpA-like protein